MTVDKIVFGSSSLQSFRLSNWGKLIKGSSKMESFNGEDVYIYAENNRSIEYYFDLFVLMSWVLKIRLLDNGYYMLGGLKDGLNDEHLNVSWWQTRSAKRYLIDVANYNVLMFIFKKVCYSKSYSSKIFNEWYEASSQLDVRGYKNKRLELEAELKQAVIREYPRILNRNLDLLSKKEIEIWQKVFHNETLLAYEYKYFCLSKLSLFPSVNGKDDDIKKRLERMSLVDKSLSKKDKSVFKLGLDYIKDHPQMNKICFENAQGTLSRSVTQYPKKYWNLFKNMLHKLKIRKIRLDKIGLSEDNYIASVGKHRLDERPYIYILGQRRNKSDESLQFYARQSSKHYAGNVEDFNILVLAFNNLLKSKKGVFKKYFELAIDNDSYSDDGRPSEELLRMEKAIENRLLENDGVELNGLDRVEKRIHNLFENTTILNKVLSYVKKR